MTYRIVWFKRDLRLHDHAPLAEAARVGPGLCLYFIEPALWALPDASARQWGFVRESLRDLRRALAERGAPATGGGRRSGGAGPPARAAAV